MEQGQFDALRIDFLDQGYLGVLQCPARRGEAAVLVAVGVADHDHLLVVATFEMRSIKIVREHGIEDLRAAFEIVYCLEQRCDIKRDFTAAVVQLTPLGEQQYRKNVIGSLCHADDERTDGFAAILAPTESDCLEDRDRFTRLRAEMFRIPFLAVERLDDARCAFLGRPVEPVLLAEAFADNVPMQMGILPYIERDQVKAEGVDAPKQALDREQATVRTGIVFEAVGDQLDIGTKLANFFVRENVIVVSRLQPLLDQAQEQPVRHVAVPQRYRVIRVLENDTVIFDARQYRLVYVDAPGRLAELG